jgi:hypothetical protein
MACRAPSDKLLKILLVVALVRSLYCILLKSVNWLYRHKKQERSYNNIDMVLQGLTLIPWLSSYFLGNALVEMILYVWSKNFPTAQVSLYGLLPVQAFYLPFVYLGLSLVLGGNPIHCILGILSGHM